MNSYLFALYLLGMFNCLNMPLAARELGRIAKTDRELEAEQVTKVIRQTEEQVQAERAEFERTLEQMFEDLDAAIAGIKEGHSLGEELTLATLQRLAPQLLKLASEVIGTHKELDLGAKSYEQELTRAVPIFLAAAREFRRFAQEEPYRDLARQYWLLSESLEAIAKKYRDLKAQISPSLSAVQGNLRYVERTALFLQRLEEVLFVLEEEDPATDRFLTSLTEYVRAFERLRKQLEAFHAATTGNLSEQRIPINATSEESSAPEGFQPERVGLKTRFQGAPPLKGIQDTTESDLSVANPSRWEDDPFKEESVALSSSDLQSLTGVWRVGISSTCLAFSQQGKKLLVGIYFSKQIQFAEGTIGIQDSALAVERLVYHLTSGQRLNVSDAELEITNSTTLTMLVPDHWRDHNNRYIRTESMRKVKLHRLSHPEIEQLKPVRSKHQTPIINRK